MLNMTRRFGGAAALLLFATTAPTALQAQDVELPDTLAVTSYDVGAASYNQAVALGTDGMVSEGSGQNLFMVRDGEIVTPPINGSNLQGLTRASAIKLAEELGVRVRIEPIPREALYVADELFFTGTATEVMPIRSLDHITIADGKRGPVTEHIQTRDQDIINGRAEDAYGWMSYE